VKLRPMLTLHQISTTLRLTDDDQSVSDVGLNPIYKETSLKAIATKPNHARVAV